MKPGTAGVRLWFHPPGQPIFGLSLFFDPQPWNEPRGPPQTNFWRLSRLGHRRVEQQIQGTLPALAARRFLGSWYPLFGRLKGNQKENRCATVGGPKLTKHDPKIPQVCVPHRHLPPSKLPFPCRFCNSRAHLAVGQHRWYHFGVGEFTTNFTLF